MSAQVARPLLLVALLAGVAAAAPNGVGVPGGGRAERRPVAPPPAPVLAVAALGEGATLAGSQDGRVRRVAASGEVQQLGRLAGAILALVAPGADGVAFALDDAGRLAAVTLGPDAAVTPRAQHAGGALDLARSADGALLATAGCDGVIRLWSPAGEERAALTGHEGPVAAVRFGAEDTLWSLGWDGTLRRWQLRRKGARVRAKQRGEARASAREGTALAVVPADEAGPERVVSACFAGDVQVWKQEKRALRGVTAPQRPHGEWIRALAVSPDGALAVAAAPAEGALVIVDLARPEAAPRVLPQAQVPAAVAFGAEPGVVLVGRFDGTVGAVRVSGAERAQSDAQESGR